MHQPKVASLGRDLCRMMYGRLPLSTDGSGLCSFHCCRAASLTTLRNAHKNPANIATNTLVAEKECAVGARQRWHGSEGLTVQATKTCVKTLLSASHAVQAKSAISSLAREVWCRLEAGCLNRSGTGADDVDDIPTST